MKKRFFITATGTNIGKSFVTAALTHQAHLLKQSVIAYKPLITGFDPANPRDSDAGLLLRSMNLPLAPENIERVSPWRFAAPLAPSMAARQERRDIDFDALVAWTRKAANGSEDTILIEGVGGIMVPIGDRHTILDWAESMDIPTLLVTGSYLGTISHTLTSLMVMEHKNILVSAIILNESEDSSVSMGETAEELGRWTKIPIIPIRRQTSADGWKDAKELREVLS